MIIMPLSLYHVSVKLAVSPTPAQTVFSNWNEIYSVLINDCFCRLLVTQTNKVELTGNVAAFVDTSLKVQDIAEPKNSAVEQLNLQVLLQILSDLLHSQQLCRIFATGDATGCSSHSHSHSKRFLMNVR